MDTDHEYCCKNIAVPDAIYEVEISTDTEWYESPLSQFNTSRLIAIDQYREIVELDLLAKGLEHCNQCWQALSLCDSLGIRPYGLSGILYVSCSCGMVNSIPLGKRHPTGVNSSAFDVNTKCAQGKICH